jgi:hypothetical protein
VGGSFLLFAQKPKVIVDQDARRPGSTDVQSILMFAQCSAIDLLGVTSHLMTSPAGSGKGVAPSH